MFTKVTNPRARTRIHSNPFTTHYACRFSSLPPFRSVPGFGSIVLVLKKRTTTGEQCVQQECIKLRNT